MSVTDRQIRVLVVTSVFPRWKSDSTPPFVYNLCHDLVEAGCHVTVLAPHATGALRLEEWNGICIERFRYACPTRLESLCYEGGMIVRLRGNRLRYLLLPFFTMAQWLRVRKLMKQGFDVVHAHSLLPQGLIAGHACRGRVPLIISSHGADVFLLASRWKGFLSRAVAGATALVANSSATRDRLLALGASPDRVKYIPATPNFLDPDDPVHSAEHPHRLLFAGRVIPEKGVDALVEAMPAILEEFPDCKLRIAGSGVLEDHLRRRISELNLQASIKLLGWLSPDELSREMRQAALLVTPSKMIEGQNLVVTEALSIGCPVATTPRGGVLDLVKEDQTGFIIPEPKPESIQNTILKVLSLPETERSRIGLAGYAHFQETFSRKRITTKTIELYESICWALPPAKA